MEKPGFFCAAPPRRGCLVLALWAALPFAAAALLCPWPAGRTGLAVLAAVLLRERGAELGIRAGFLSEYAVAPTPDMARTLVVNYAGLDPARLEAAMALLAEWFAES